MEKTEFDYLLQIRNLKMHFPVKAGIVLDHVVGWVKALDGIDLTIKPQASSGNGGRVRKRKDHPFQSLAPAREADEWGGALPGEGHTLPGWFGVKSLPSHHSGGLSGSFCLSEPPSQGPTDHFGAPGSFQHPEQERAGNESGGSAANGGPGHRTDERSTLTN